jgi:protein tyrosine phosphatase
VDIAEKDLGPIFNWEGIDESNDKSSPSETVGAVGMEGDYLELQEVPKPTSVSVSTQLQALDHGLAEHGGELVCHREYDSVPKRKADATYHASVKGANAMKNRYKDVLPCKRCQLAHRACSSCVLFVFSLDDDTRVRLTTLDNDYINANHVTLTVNGHNLWYIAAQGPMPNTVADFWQMTWDQSSQLIVMVTTEVEAGRTKCERYWPSEEGENGAISFGDYKISLLKQEGTRDYVVRCLRVHHLASGTKRTIWHMQFMAWPDHGVPPASSFLAFMDEITELRNRLLGADSSAPAWPTLVHCSAGIGRTGVLILVDAEILKLRYSLTPAPLDTLQDLREQRPGIIQTPDQYGFCYSVLRDVLLNQSNVAGSTAL